MTSSVMEQENNSPASSSNFYWLLLPQALVGLVDAVSMMVVAPSVVFYVYSLGGTKEQYGIILSVFSFASFLFKPVLGYWCDKSGYKFTLPYLSTLVAAALGGLSYFLASAFTGRTAIALLFLGRFLGGIGAANSTLGFTYIAAVIPHDQMTQASSLLSMVRVLGMAAAPGMNVFLSDVQGTIGSMEVTPLNSVGLFLMFANIASFFVILFLLEEPPEDKKPGAGGGTGGPQKSEGMWKSMFSLGIILPLMSILTLNANFQLLETGLAPAAKNILNWGPVAISTMFGANSIIIFIFILVSFKLASMGVSDLTMLYIGLVLSSIGYSLLYFCWQQGVGMWVFLLPFFFSTCGFPFLAAPTRSIFTRAIDADPLLRDHQGSMQAVMSMGASIAGFAAPGLIAAFVLRTPEQVAASADHREFTAWALFAPIFSIIVLVGFIYLDCSAAPAATTPADVDWDKVIAEGEDKEKEPSERTSLLAGGILPHSLEIPRHFHPLTEAHRRQTITIMGVPQISFHADGRQKVTRHTIAV